MTEPDDTPDVDGNEGIEDALQDAITNSGLEPGMVSNWFVCAKYITESGQQGWFWTTPADQAVIDTAGLVDWAKRLVDIQARFELEEFAFDWDDE